MVKSKLRAAFLVAGTLGAGCTETVRAQEVAPTSEEAPAPATKADEATKPAAQRPIDEGAIRALAEEVARLRAQIAELNKAKQTPAPSLVEPVRPREAQASTDDELRFGGADSQSARSDTAPSAFERDEPVYVDREVPVYVDREVPVYVDREIVVERPTTVVLERVVYGADHCDQWIPVRHVHSIGCGHHYYGCACHPWYYDLGTSFSLNFSFVHVDNDNHRSRGHNGHGNGHHNGHHNDGHRDGQRDGHRDGRSDGYNDGRSQPHRGGVAGADASRIGPDRSPGIGRTDDGRERGRSEVPRHLGSPEVRPNRGRVQPAVEPVAPSRPQRTRIGSDETRPQRGPAVPPPLAGTPQIRTPRESVREPRDRAPQQPRVERRPQPRPERRPDASPRPGRSHDAPPPPPPTRRHKKN